MVTQPGGAKQQFGSEVVQKGRAATQSGRAAKQREAVVTQREVVCRCAATQRGRVRRLQRTLIRRLQRAQTRPNSRQQWGVREAVGGGGETPLLSPNGYRLGVLGVQTLSVPMGI